MQPFKLPAVLRRHLVFDVQIAHSVQEVGQKEWDRLGGEQPFASYRWVRFGESILVDDSPLYVILSRQGEPLARAMLWLRKQQNMLTSSQVMQVALGAILRRRPILTCEAPLSNSVGLTLPPEPALRREALRTLSACALDLAKQHRASFLVFGYLSAALARLPGWPDALTAIGFQNSGTVLPIAWHDFDGYLSSLSRWARKSVRQNLRRAAEQGIVVRVQPEITDIEGALGLIQNVDRRHNRAPNPQARSVLERVAMVDHVWLTAEAEGRLVGCALLLADRGVMIQALLGLDYAVQYAYFALFYETIRAAIKGEQRALRGGYAAYDMKRRLGFVVEDANRALFAGNGAFRPLGRWLAASFREEEL